MPSLGMFRDFLGVKLFFLEKHFKFFIPFWHVMPCWIRLGDYTFKFGVTFEFNDRQVIIDMMPCLGKATEDFPVKFRNNHGAMTPAGVDMFEEDQLTKLDEEFKGIFHGVTLSFGSERARPDTQPIVALLCVRVK